MGIVGCEQFAVGADEEYRSRGEREYARCRIAEYSSLRFAGVSLRGRRLGNWFLVLSSEWRSEERAECYGSG